MKKSLLNLIGVFLSASVLAQPALDASDLNYQIGMTYGNSSAQYINPGSGGANVTWDFSAFSASGNNILKITAGNPSFPNSNITSSSNPNAESYINENSSGKYVWGTNAGGVLITYTKPSKILFYPLTYTASEVNIHEATFTSGITFTRAGVDKVTYDGYGTVITPNGTYDNAIRVVLHQEYTDTYQGGSIDYVANVYMWYIAGYPDHIASVSEIHMNGQLFSSYGFYSTSQSLSLLSEENKEFSIFPNPATEEIKFKTLNNFEVTEVKIVNRLGQIVKSKAFDHMTINETNVNVSDLESGVYFIHITGKNGTIQSRKFIKQ